MVFRGRPSKACERCRARRLKCDLRPGTCGSCLRARLPCSGYRDTQQLRIRDESLAVAQKVTKYTSYSEPKYLPLSVDSQARDAFNAYYHTGASKCWDCLTRYYHPRAAPDHLTLAIEALSLAFLWHQIYSDAALAAARKRYIVALSTLKSALKSPKEATKHTTLLSSLLLDLFEKMTDRKPRNNKSWTSHVAGGLALIRLRGLDKFQDPSEFHILRLFSGQFLLSCIASSVPVPDDLIAIRRHVWKHSDVQDPMCQMSDTIIRYANLRNRIQLKMISNDEHLQLAKEIDAQLQVQDLNMPPSWQYTTSILDQKSDKTFGLRYDSYPHRNICHAWNIIRTTRILLNESLIELYSAIPANDEVSAQIALAQANIEKMVHEICAGVPQYLDCDGATSKRPTKHGPTAARHIHRPNHQAECYSIIFPLYAAGRSKATPDIRDWVINQLRFMASHFCIRNADVVAQILERGTDVDPWEIYAMLGSYAFTA